MLKSSSHDKFIRAITYFIKTSLPCVWTKRFDLHSSSHTHTHTQQTLCSDKQLFLYRQRVDTLYIYNMNHFIRLDVSAAVYRLRQASRLRWNRLHLLQRKQRVCFQNVIFILNISLCLTDSCNLNLNIVTVVEVEDFRVSDSNSV